MTFDELVISIQSLNTEDAFRPRLDKSQWKAFGAYLSQHQVRAGDLLIRQGNSDRQAYFLGQGTLQVYLKTATAPTGRIAILRAGAIVGEAGLFSQGGRMANVEAMTPCLVWALQLPRFEEMAQRMPAIGLEVLRAAAAVMASRMRANLTQKMPLA
jgi:CRP/FNR family cyclic AMP-dependent transcriptional regulator